MPSWKIRGDGGTGTGLPGRPGRHVVGVRRRLVWSFVGGRVPGRGRQRLRPGRVTWEKYRPTLILFYTSRWTWSDLSRLDGFGLNFKFRPPVSHSYVITDCIEDMSCTTRLISNSIGAVPMMLYRVSKTVQLEEPHDHLRLAVNKALWNYRDGLIRVAQYFFSMLCPSLIKGELIRCNYHSRTKQG